MKKICQDLFPWERIEEMAAIVSTWKIENISNHCKFQTPSFDK